MNRTIWYLAFVLLWTTTGWAVTVTVPGDFPFIYAAIDNCVSGDTILVAPGTYEEYVNFDGKDLVIIGDVDDPSTTVIDALGGQRVVWIFQGESSAAVLAGFHLTNADQIVVSGYQSNPTIRNCILSNATYFPVWMGNESLINLSDNEYVNNGINEISMEGGTFTGDRHISNDGLPYRVNFGLRIIDYDGDPISRLSIDPGTTLLFQQDTRLTIGGVANQGGELYAVGSMDEPITFRSMWGITGSWDGIVFTDGSDYETSTSRIEHCIIENAGNIAYPYPAGITCENTDQPLVTYSTIQNCNGYAVYLQDTAMIQMTDNVITGNAYDAICVSGRTINESMTWPRNDVPYHVVDTIYVLNTNDPPYPTLTIEAGTELLFDEDAGLQIGGFDYGPAQLIAVGTEQLPITMSSISGAPGGWSGILFMDTSDMNGVESTMDWCIISCAGLNGAGFNFTANMCCYNTTQPTITNCSFTNSSGYGLLFSLYSGSISDSRVSTNADDGINAYGSVTQLVRIEMNNNGDDGIELYSSPGLTIGSEPTASCQIFNNGGYNVRVTESADSVSARYNYWGTLDPDEIEASIYDELDDPGLGKVQWAPAVNMVQDPDVLITTTPYHAPILIGPAGGYFRFAAQIQSQEIFPIQIDAWTEFILPNGSTYGPVDLYEGLNMPAGATINAAPFQEMPGYAPAGTYHFVSKVGMYPTARDSSSFEVLKIEYPAARRWFQSWQTWGWFGDEDFDEEAVLAMLTGEDLDTDQLPTEFEVGDVYPNPFNARASLSIALPSASPVSVVVYNVTGQRVMTVASGDMAAGYHTLTVDASALASGLYFVRTDVPGQLSMTQKMVVVK